MHVTDSKVFNKKKVARNCVQLTCVFRVEREESHKCVESLHSDGRFIFASYYVTHCRVNVFLFPFLFFLTSPCTTVPLFPNSGEFASRDMTVSFRVWLSGRDDFRREWYNSTAMWVKMFYLFPIV